MVAQMEEMLENVSSEKERQAIIRCMEQLDRE